MPSDDRSRKKEGLGGRQVEQGFQGIAGSKGEQGSEGDTRVCDKLASD